ncbi:MAG: histidine phosphatase family protein [Campylobacter sp.]|nr:histidine phosphatase family protein [Campylobacter sp.]
MKRFYFIRHAKAVKKAGIKDKQRPLSKDGQNAITLIAKELKKLSFSPEIIYSSRSVRTMQTTKVITNELKFKQKIIYTDKLYTFETALLKEFIKHIPPKFTSVAIVGHNDGLTELCEYLSDSVIGNIPTSGVIAMKFKCDKFDEIFSTEGEIEYFIYPKKFA